MKGKMGCKTCGGGCESCKTTSWLAPLVIIGLIWFGPIEESWTKVVITLAAVAVASSVWVYGCMAVWVCTWLYGCIGAWVYGRTNPDPEL